MKDVTWEPYENLKNLHSYFFKEPDLEFEKKVE